MEKYHVVNDYLHPDQEVACPHCQFEVDFLNLDEGKTFKQLNEDGSEETVIDYLVKCPRCERKFIIRSHP